MKRHFVCIACNSAPDPGAEGDDKHDQLHSSNLVVVRQQSHPQKWVNQRRGLGRTCQACRQKHQSTYTEVPAGMLLNAGRVDSGIWWLPQFFSSLFGRAPGLEPWIQCLGVKGFLIRDPSTYTKEQDPNYTGNIPAQNVYWEQSWA
jgi:hypothetical protein